MAQNECIPYYDDGDHISGICDAPVVGKRFVKINADRSGGTIDLTATTAGDGGAPHIATAAVGGRIHGVAAYDGAQGALIDVIRGSKMVVPVKAGAPISAWEEVAVGTGGTAVPAGTDVYTAATLDTGVVASNNAITWTAKAGGSVGNDITITLHDPGGTTADPSVDVDGQDIVVNLTRAGNAITMTAAQVQAAVAANDDAAALVSTADKSTSTGAAAVAAVPTTHLAGGSQTDVRTLTAVGYALANAGLDDDAQISLY